MSQLRCPSRIAAVTVHARGALVVRAVTPPAALPDGDATLEVGDVTLGAAPGSLRAELEGGARQVVAIDSAVEIPAGAAPRGPTREERERLEDVATRLRAELELVDAQRGQLAALQARPHLRIADEVLHLDGRMADALALVRFAGEREAALDARRQQLFTELDRVTRELEAARLAEVQASSAPDRPSRRVVRVRIAGAGPLTALRLVYFVPAARWWPTYALRVSDGGRRVELAADAWVAQASGEDWSGVELALSTADPIVDARLPELKALRIGRRAPEPVRRGYRPPPSGLDALFAGYARAFGEAARRAREPEYILPPSSSPDATPTAQPSFGAPADEGAFADEVAAELDVDRMVPTTVRRVPAPPKSAPRPMAPPAPPPSMAMASPAGAVHPQMMKKGARARSSTGGMPAMLAGAAPGGGGWQGEAAAAPEPEPETLEPADAWLDFDRLVLGDNDDAQHRGRLVRRPLPAAAGASLDGAAPAGVTDPAEARGAFDHRWDAPGRVGVPSDGLVHRVSLGAAPAAARMRYRAVPREAPEVYRELELDNPLPGPLLAGPADVFVEGALLLTAPLGRVDVGGPLRVGLGVEERVRVARNVRYAERQAGLLGGSTVTEAEITLEIASALGAPLDVELLERLPVSRADDLEVKLLDARPKPQPYTQAERGVPVDGGLAFTVAVPAGGKAEAVWRYALAHPAKSEVVGGARRE